MPSPIVPFTIQSDPLPDAKVEGLYFGSSTTHRKSEPSRSGSTTLQSRREDQSQDAQLAQLRDVKTLDYLVACTSLPYAHLLYMFPD